MGVFPSSVNFAIGTYGHFNSMLKLFGIVEDEMFTKLNEILGNGVFGPYAVEIPISTGGACIGKNASGIVPQGLKCC